MPSGGLILGRTATPRTAVMGFGIESAPTPSELITYSGDSPLMTICPTGGGKTAGPVITNALIHPGAAIIVDIKGEVYATTARQRAKFGPVYAIDLRDDAHGKDMLNPLDLCLYGAGDPDQAAQALAADLVIRTGGERETFWNDWAETLIAGCIAHLFADRPPEKQTLSALFDLIHGEDFRYQLAAILDRKSGSPAATAAFLGFLSVSADMTHSSITATTQQQIRLFGSQMSRKVTAGTTIDLAGLIAGESMTIYFIIPPAQLNSYRPLLRAWLSGIIMALTSRKSAPLYRTLLLCDEIAALGRMPAFVTAATLLRGWGVTLWSFWQATSQLAIYGDDAKTLLDNAGVLQLSRPKNFRVAKDFCDLVGGITPEAVMALHPDEQLLLIEGGHPHVARQVRYYNDPAFAGLFDPNPLVANHTRT